MADISSINGNPIVISRNGIKSKLEPTENLLAYKLPFIVPAGVTTLEIADDGSIVIVGTPSSNGVITISNDIELEAGTYTYVPFSGFRVGVTTLQCRKIEDGVDVGAIAAAVASAPMSFTIDEATTVRFRISYYSGVALNQRLQPMFIAGTNVPSMFMPPYSIVDYMARMYADRVIASLDEIPELVHKAHVFAANEVIDADTDMATPGIYRASSLVVASNMPDNPASNYLVFTIGSDNGRYLIQIYVAYLRSEFKVCSRWRHGGTLAWSSWEVLYDAAYPEVIDRLTDEKVLRQVIYTSNGGIPNVGEHLTVLSYNVAKYNKDTTTYLSDAQVLEFRRMLSKAKPDVACIQEEREYIDGDNMSKDTRQHLYNPILPYKRGGNNLGIYSRFELPNGGLVRYTDDWPVNRELRWGTCDINGKTLLICDTHPISRANGDISVPVDDPSSIAARLVEYTHMMQWVTGEIDLAWYSTINGYDSTRRMYCPEWDYCIICGDMNSCTTEDQDNLHQLVIEAGFTMANGGWLGWLETCRNLAGTNLYSIDNVICSPNVIINSVNVYRSLYWQLHSDHYPFVVDLTLVDA